ncbi:hypothetical protein RJ640_007618 [Escallonia rubra]|uniref:Glutathione S-transferase n=1 Tax=Escallonia rubra TaxID=112253 RepID=A0AA88RZX8_9ASTE|nr:hypothetical protein RJ640_007618 [Escallonia rubra]
MEEVKLHEDGQVHLTSDPLKGIPFEYIEEDLSNRSDLILKCNPVHKKVPVCVHAGKPIREAMMSNPLLPSDPYDGAVDRFWAKFAEDKGIVTWSMYRTSGEEQQKAIKNSLELLKNIEEHALGQKEFFGRKRIGIIDIALGWGL